MIINNWSFSYPIKRLTTNFVISLFMLLIIVVKIDYITILAISIIIFVYIFVVILCSLTGFLIIY